MWQDDEEPQYGDLTYLAMVWCAGVAIGLIFYGASEPLTHVADGTNRCAAVGFRIARLASSLLP